MTPQEMAALVLDDVWRGDPSRWTKGVIAKDTHGRVVPSTSESAVCWCLAGAALKIAEPRGMAGRDVAAFLGEFCKVIGQRGDAFFWQDRPTRTFEEVVAAVECVAGRRHTLGPGGYG